jgi:Kef-type K+ transport system membrane component KefB
MSDGTPVPATVLLVGLLVIGNALIKFVLDKVGLPPMAGYLVLGGALGVVDRRLGILTTFARDALAFLAAVGVVILLFRVGLESNPRKLLRLLPVAGPVLVADVVPNAILGFVAARYLLGTDVVPALFAAVALTATSVGVSLAPWRDADAVSSDAGALLLDVAELDDIAGVLLMALLLAFVHGLAGTDLAGTAIALAARLVILAALCLLFARYVEASLTRWFSGPEDRPDLVVLVAGIGLAIAAAAGLLGFSLAIGAALAGLSFSRDTHHRTIDRSLSSLFQLLTPFFFIGIGLGVELEGLTAAAWVALVLLLAGVLGKLAGVGAAVARRAGWTVGLLVGVSMVPRAEIALIIVQQGHRLGEAVVSPVLYSGMVLMSLGSSILATLAVPTLLHRYPPRTSRLG